MTARFGSGLLFLWIFVFVAFLGGDVTPHVIELRSMAILFYGIPIAIAGLWACLKDPHPTDIWIAILIAAYGAVSLLSSDRTASLETLGLVTAYAGVFVIGIRIRAPHHRSRIALAIATAVTVWALILGSQWSWSAIAWLVEGGAWPPPSARSPILWLSTDAVAALILLGAPFYFWIKHRAIRRVLGSLTLLGAAVIFALSGGRVELIGLAAAVLVWGAVVALPRNMVRRVPLIGAAAILVTVGAVTVVVFAFGSDPTLSGRTFIWSNVLNLIGSNPIAGSGPGTLSWARLEHAAPYVDRVGVYHAHNLILQTAADGGILLLVGFLAAISAFVRHLVRGIARLSIGATMAVGSLAGFGVILQLDELTQLPAFTAIALLQAGFLLRESQPSSLLAAMPARLLPATLAVALLLAAPSVLAVQVARAEAQAGRSLAASGDWSSALMRFSHAMEAWPTNAIYRMSIGLALTHLEHREEARNAYGIASELSPGDPRPFGALAALAESTGDRVDLLTTAAQLANRDAQYSFRLASDLWANGEHDQAIDAYARAAALNSQILGLLPSEGPTSAIIARAMLTFSAGVTPAMRIDVQRLEGEAHAILGVVVPGDPWTTRSVAYARMDDLERAMEAADQAIVNREGADAYRVAAAVARIACDEASARRYDRLASFLPLESGNLYATGHVTGTRDHVYRERGMGDYQPRPPVGDIPPSTAWPAALMPDAVCSQTTGGS